MQSEPKYCQVEGCTEGHVLMVRQVTMVRSETGFMG